MNFENNFLEIILSDNELTDGLFSCLYTQLPTLLNSLENYLDKQGIKPDDCVAVECNNSLPSALLLILLLKRQQGFMLLPPSENKEQISTLKPIPQFCQYRLVIKSVKKTDAPQALENPALFLNIESCNASSQIKTRGKLFLRTSGSMGAAKIVVHSHEHVLGSAKNVISKYHFTSEDRFAIPVPIFHLYGFGAEFLPAVLLGASLDLQENTNLLKYLDRERRFNPTVAFVTPNLCEMILRGRKTPRPYKTIVVSGQRISEELFLAFDDLCGHTLINQYGSSEMGPIAACSVTDSQAVRVKTIGQPMNCVELRIEKDGNLYCQHPFRFLGYMDETGNWLSASQDWQRTGDMATCNSQGEMTVTGRADNSLNRSGYLILLADVERMMEQLDYLAQVAVIATKAQDIQGQKLRAFCVLKSASQAVDIEKIRQDCQTILPKYAVPDEIVILDKFPLLPSGKTDQQALQNWSQSSNHNLTKLFQQYQSVLQIKEINVEEMLAQAIEFDFKKAFYALTEIQSVDVNQILKNFFLDAVAMPELLANPLGLNHIGFECCQPLDVVFANLPNWLEKFSLAFQESVTLKKSLRFSASQAFQQRVNAKVEILCLWLSVGEKLLMLELFDIARPITNLLPNNVSEFDKQQAAMAALFSSDNIWHYSINVGEQEQVERLHQELQTLCEQNAYYKLAYNAPIQNQYDGSFHTKLINLKCHLELEFAKTLRPL